MEDVSFMFDELKNAKCDGQPTVALYKVATVLCDAAGGFTSGVVSQFIYDGFFAVDGDIVNEIHYMVSAGQCVEFNGEFYAVLNNRQIIALW